MNLFMFHAFNPKKGRFLIICILVASIAKYLFYNKKHKKFPPILPILPFFKALLLSLEL